MANKGQSCRLCPLSHEQVPLRDFQHIPVFLLHTPRHLQVRQTRASLLALLVTVSLGMRLLVLTWKPKLARIRSPEIHLQCPLRLSLHPASVAL